MIVLFNPKSARWKHRLPLSLLSLGAVLEGRYPYTLVDGNLVSDAGSALIQAIEGSGARYLGVTVMPGPQLQEAIPLTRAVKARFPEIVVIWGGYFPSLHSDVVLESGLVDYVIRGQGELPFLELIDELEKGTVPDGVRSLSYRREGIVTHNPIRGLTHPDQLPPLPYHRVVDMEPYIGETCLGSRTISYHSSFGCPFLCGFCAVAGVYRGGWSGRSADRVAEDVLWLRKQYGIDSVEFFDNNFFVGERRAYEIADRLCGQNVRWWGEARPDTLMGYSDATWRKMADGGLHMVFFGVESSSAGVLDSMDKGGTQTPEMVMDLVGRTERFGIIPALSFVLGIPGDDVDAQIEADIRYIRAIKKINPRAEIVIYVYSPVHFDDAALFGEARDRGFAFPTRLEEWMDPAWTEFDLRKKPSTPWLTTSHLRRIRNFEWVLNASYPTISDIRLRTWQILAMKALGMWRYRTRFYDAPYEIRFVANRLFRYRQPETEGF